jgi:hypothetical protein
MSFKPLYVETEEVDGIASYEQASLEDILEWFLHYYEGMEHMTEHGVTNPETWYTVTTILRRNLERIKSKVEVQHDL